MKKKDYCAAIDYFFKAIATDPLYVYSHYNLACVLSLLLAGNKTAAGLNEEQMLDSALAELRTCIALDASFKETIKTDSDLEFVRKTPQFLLLEDTVFNLQDFKDLLVKGRCYFPGLTKDRGYLYFFENSQCGYEDGAKTKLYKDFYYTFQEKERQVARLFFAY